MNKQKTVAETIPYEAPQMQVVPIRTSGMLCASGDNPRFTRGDDGFVTAQSLGGGSTPGNAANEWSSPSEDDHWGTNFF